MTEVLNETGIYTKEKIEI